MRTLFQQFGVTQSDCTQFLRREVRVAEHTLEAVHVNVRDVTDHKDGLLHLTRVTDEVLDLAEPVIELLSLFVNLYGFLKIVDHIGRRRGCLHNISCGIDDTLGKIGRVGHHPLCFRREADKEAAHTQHEDFLFHDVSVFNCE